MLSTCGARIHVKGTRKGLYVTFGEGPWALLLQELEDRLTQAHSFFRGSQMNLAIGQREVNQEDLLVLMALLEKYQVQLASVRCKSETVIDAVNSLGLRIALPESIDDQPGMRAPTENVSEGFLLRRTLRSGQSLQHPGHVVVIGDVNPGAEIVAGGDVVVWGRVKGMVHAGALGDNDAIVCALRLAPTQLRIGSHIATSPTEDESGGLQPERAFVQNGQIVAEPWSGELRTTASEGHTRCQAK